MEKISLKNYRSISDSGEIDIDIDMQCTRYCKFG